MEGMSHSEGGSSPLARGTPDTVLRSMVKVGLIPARAGNTRCALARGLGGRAHPRSRGEHVSELRKLREVVGSSPLARGTHHADLDSVSEIGLIPARAGNTCRRRC